MVASVARFPKRQHIARFDSFAFPHYRRCVCISYFILRYCLLFIFELSRNFGLQQNSPHPYTSKPTLSSRMSPVCMLLLQPLFGGSGVCHHCLGWASQPRADFWNRASAVAACHPCLGWASQPRADFWNRASAILLGVEDFRKY